MNYASNVTLTIGILRLFPRFYAPICCPDGPYSVERPEKPSASQKKKSINSNHKPATRSNKEQYRCTKSQTTFCNG